jgi:hypothetical protein
MHEIIFFKVLRARYLFLDATTRINSVSNFKTKMSISIIQTNINLKKNPTKTLIKRDLNAGKTRYKRI